MMAETDVQSHLPLTEATFFILLSLAPEPKHGYAIMKDVGQLSGQRVVLSTGTLYGALKRLLGQGWIERVREEEQTQMEPTEAGRPRKAYALTDLGRRVLQAEMGRLDSLVTTARLQTAKGPA